MGQYRLENILTQEIPDGLLMEIAYHWQANDNHLLDPRSSGSRLLDHDSGWGQSGLVGPPH